MFPPVAKLCLWYMCFCAEVFFFLFSHSLGVNFFFPLFSHVNAVFFFHSLSSCSVYPVVILVLVTSDNKGLLLLLHYNEAVMVN